MDWKDYERIVNDLDVAFAVSAASSGRTARTKLYAEAATAIRDLRRDLKDCRNELCLKCGNYKLAHKGACDGCRWKDLGD